MIEFISLVWCFIVLWASLSVTQIPRTSHFPEIDFAANISLDENINHCHPSETRPVTTSLSELSNSDSAGIRKRFAFIRLVAKFSKAGLGMEENKEVEFKENNLS